MVDDISGISADQIVGADNKLQELKLKEEKLLEIEKSIDRKTAELKEIARMKELEGIGIVGSHPRETDEERVKRESNKFLEGTGLTI